MEPDLAMLFKPALQEGLELLGYIFICYGSWCFLRHKEVMPVTKELAYEPIRNDIPKFDIKPEVLDELLRGARTPGEINALFKDLKKAILERALSGELTHHLGYAKGDAEPEGKRTAATARHPNINYFAPHVPPPNR